MITLYIKDKKGNLIEEFILGEGTHSIGRIPENSVVIKDMKVSRQHAKLIVSEGKCILEDIQSRSGTYINNNKIANTSEVKPGDVITIGDKTLQISFESYSGTSFNENQLGKLDITSPPEIENEIFLNKDVMVMGRVPECDIQVLDKQASREHARIFTEDKCYYIEDGKSVNGTYVNGKKITKHPLKNGDVISIGSFSYAFSLCNMEYYKNSCDTMKMRCLESDPSKQKGKKGSFFKWASVILFMGAVGGASYHFRTNLLQIWTKLTTKKTEKVNIIDETPLASPVTVIALQKETFRAFFDETGGVEAFNRVLVSSTFEGKYKEVRVAQGDFVKKDMVLVVIDNKFIANDLKTARSQLEEAIASFRGAKNIFRTAKNRLDLARSEKQKMYRSYKGGVVPETKYNQAKDNYFSARQNYEKARTEAKRIHKKIKTIKTKIEKLKERQDDTLVRAPISGTVENLKAKVGQVYAQNLGPIMHIVSINKVYIVVRITQRDIVKIWKGQKVTIISSAYPDDEFLGVVKKIGSTFRQSDRTTEVKVEVNNEKLKLKPGNFVTAKFLLGEHKDVMATPKEAITSSYNKKYICIVKNITIKDGKK